MLTYVNQGIRYYGERPIRVYTRFAYEIQLLSEGQAIYKTRDDSITAHAPVLF